MAQRQLSRKGSTASASAASEVGSMSALLGSQQPTGALSGLLLNSAANSGNLSMAAVAGSVTGSVAAEELYSSRPGKDRDSRVSR